MKTYEKGVLPESNYYIHSPSLQAQKTFLYPLFIGTFIYESGYTVNRQSFDSFLIMYVRKGSISLLLNDVSYEALENQLIIIDCFAPHKYWANRESEVVWLHFDGIVAREYFSLITKNNNFIIALKDPFNILKNMNNIYNLFLENKSIIEPLISLYITNILTDIIMQQDISSSNFTTSKAINDSITYINQNITKELTLDILASNVSLSPYYFTRTFKKETGFTPYQYVLYVRINHAKFLLKNSNFSIKDICFLCGFTCESSFCTSFKKCVNSTPTEYRNNIIV